VDLLFWRAADIATVRARAGRLATATGLDADRLLDWCSAFAGMCALDVALGDADVGPPVEALLSLASRP
jgi:hypothetical protein